MIENCRQQITSEDYADYIVEYNHDATGVLDYFQSDCINIIDRKYAVVHTPVSDLNQNSIVQFGYSVFPTGFSLEASSSLEEAGVIRLKNIPGLNLEGISVIIAIIDTGIDYTNPIFQNSDGTTRIISIWDQTIESENYPEGIYYGTVYSREQINEALKSPDPYSIVPSRDTNGHGTMIAGIAGGSPSLENNFTGVAIGAEFVIVKLKEAKTYLKDFYVIPQDAVCYQENDIMFGLKYASMVATDEWKVLSICIALSSNQGSHDGRGPLSDCLSYTAERVGTVIVVSAGNEGNRGHHFYGEIGNTSNYETVELVVPADEPGFTMEIWGSAPNTYSIDILSPTGQYIERIPPRLGENREITFEFENTVVDVDYILLETHSGDQLILVRMRRPTEGLWKFRVYGYGDVNMNFHAWLPTYPFIDPQTRFIRPTLNTTVTNPGTSRLPITVTAYDFRTGSIYSNASRGYTRNGIIKPEMAAPGVNMVIPRLDHSFGTGTGTSIAAAFTAGISALLLQWGIIEHNLQLLDSLTVKKMLLWGLNRSPHMEYPNPTWGYGTLNIYNTFIRFMNEDF